MRKNGSRQEMRCSQTPNRRRRFSAFNVIDRELQIAALKVWNSITAAAELRFKKPSFIRMRFGPGAFPSASKRPTRVLPSYWLPASIPSLRQQGAR